MQLRRRFFGLVGLVDLAIAMVVFIAIVLPPREMYAAAAMKGSEPEQFALALAEARTMAHPDDGALADELSHKLSEAGFKDWAVEVGIDASARAKQSPSRWRALLATSVAYVDRLEAVPALDYAKQALAACEAAGAAACPSWESIRMDLYEQHLAAGVASKIDPKKNPKAFRAAGQSGLRTIHLGGGHDRDQTPVAPTQP
jgi:hypothetical protein